MSPFLESIHQVLSLSGVHSLTSVSISWWHRNNTLKAAEVVLQGKKVGDVITLKPFTSASLSADTLRSEHFLGAGPGLGRRTVLQIAAVCCRLVSGFSVRCSVWFLGAQKCVLCSKRCDPILRLLLGVEVSRRLIPDVSTLVV
jgi:hypothetical protein